MELLLLLVRAALKRRPRDRLRLRLRAGSKNDEADFRREFAWLLERADKTALYELSRSLLGPVAEKRICDLVADPEALKRLISFVRAVRPQLRRYRTYGPLGAPALALLREIHWIIDAINRRYLHYPTPLRRVSPRGGTVIVLLGSDGSGKSSLSKALVSWLGVKLDVMPIYFGSGDGTSSLVRLPLVLARRLLAPALGSTEKATSGAGAASEPSTSLRKRVRKAFRAGALVPWALALSLEKRSKMRRMVRARNRGMIVVCDRFAQADIPGFNDGPLLTHWQHSPRRLCRAIAAWEAKPHRETKFDPPDLVLKLNVTPEVALSRRPEMSLEEIRRRVQAVQSLRFPKPAKVVEIGTDVPIEEVTLSAKRLVWDQI